MVRVLLVGSILGFILSSCNSGPKVIETTVENETTASDKSTGIFSGMTADTVQRTPGASSPATNAGFHTVVAEEVLPTEKYVYVRVKEGADEYWIATRKMEVEIGQTYFYKDGLLKTNFVSKEYNRTFDKVYLVGRLVPPNHGGRTNNETSIPQISPKSEISNDRAVLKKGSMKIADLVANPKKYKGKTVQITGKCTKLNANIMGRNWMHLQDGSKDDYDLVITSDVAIPEGHIVTMKATVALNKDFGAGYKYDIILENGEIVK